MTISHYSSNLNFTHGVTREVAKPQCAVAPQIKQGQLTTTNNPQYAIKNESLQLQMRKCPIYGQHMGAPQCITCNYYTKVATIIHCSSNPNVTHVSQERL